MVRKWDTTDEALKRTVLSEVIARVQDIDDPSTVGIIAAEDIVDIVLAKLGPEIYNKGIADAKKLIAEKLADIDIDLTTLEVQA